MRAFVSYALLTLLAALLLVLPAVVMYSWIGLSISWLNAFAAAAGGVVLLLLVAAFFAD